MAQFLKKKESNRFFSKGEIKMATKHITRCSTSLGKCKSKLKWDITSNPQWLKFIFLKKVMCWEDVEESENPDNSAGGNVKGGIAAAESNLATSSER